jgi:hypothetical protein
MIHDILLDPSMFFHHPTLDLLKQLHSEQYLDGIYIPESKDGNRRQ